MHDEIAQLDGWAGSQEVDNFQENQRDHWCLPETQGWTQKLEGESKKKLYRFLLAYITHFLILAYYDGALTMFFADDVPQLFTSKLELMEAYPEWKLNVMNGAQIFFQVKADNGNKIYQNYIQTMKDSPKEVLYETVEEGESKMKQRKNVRRHWNTIDWLVCLKMNLTFMYLDLIHPILSYFMGNKAKETLKVADWGSQG